MIYKFRYDSNIFEDNPGLLAIKEFAVLEDRQMKYVTLVCDPSYDNPVRTLPEKTRKEKAIIIAGYPLEDGKRPNKNAREIIAGNKPTIEAAISKFLELNHDEKQDTLETTKSLIETNKNYIKEVNNTKEDKKGKDYGKDLERANKFQKELPSLIEAQQKIEELLKIQYNQKPDFGPQAVGVEMVQNFDEKEESLEQQSTIDNYMSQIQKNRE
jgi:hypothetical protein